MEVPALDKSTARKVTKAAMTWHIRQAYFHLATYLRNKSEIEASWQHPLFNQPSLRCLSTIALA